MINQLRVLHLGRFDNLQYPGGLQIYVKTLMDSMATRVIADNFVASVTMKSWQRKEGDNTIVAAASYGTIAGVPFAPRLFFNVFKAWRKNKYDVIHLHFPDPLAMLIVWMLAPKVPIVVTWHSDVIRQRWAFFFYIPMLRAFLKKVAAVIVATPKHITSCAQLDLYPYRDRIAVIPFGVETSRLELKSGKVSAVEQLRAKHRGKTILFGLGRHVYYKGYTYLLKAMTQVNNAHLILGGSGPLTEELKAQAKRDGIEDRVTFAGQIPEEDLPVYLHACDIFAFPSVDPSEAYGFAQIEAMLCGKPVICCELGNGVTYVNQDGFTGLAVEPRNPAVLAGAIESLVKNTEYRSKLGSQALTRAQNEFSLKVMGDRIFALYSSLVKRA